MQIQTVVEKFRQQKVLVIGELMLDVYIAGTAGRICREAPVPVVSVDQRAYVPGAAANTALNLAALGAQTTYLTVTGDDAEAQRVFYDLQTSGIETSYSVCDPARQTITKKRVVAEKQLLLRYDAGSIDPIDGRLEHRLIHNLRALYPQMDVVVVSDYGYGVLTDGVIEALRTLQEQHPKPLVIDSKHLARFRALRPTVVKPNYGEALELLNLQPEQEGRRAEQMIAHQHTLLEQTGAALVAVTLDSEGAILFQNGAPCYRTNAKIVAHPHTAGAGDTYVSAFALAFSVGLSAADAADLAGAAAGVVIEKAGTASCSAVELMNLFKPAKLIDSLDALRLQVERYRQQGRRIVFTNGCFDILHVGHVTYLAQAKARGDVLIIGVNSDESVRQLKGLSRPINPLDDRIRVLAALDSVDHVIAFGESSPVELIRVIKPDCYVKGGDYTKASLPEAPLVEALGGTVEILPYVMERSTTAVIKKIRTLG